MSNTEQVVHELGSILNAILQPADDVRKQAEQRLDQLLTPGHSGDAAGVGETLYGLAVIGQGAGGYAVELRTLSLVLLRRQSFRSIPLPNPTANGDTNTTPFDSISEAARGKVEASLLLGLENELDAKIRKGLADVVGKWVDESAKRGRPLADLPPLLLRLTGSPSPLHRLTVYQLLYSSPDLLFTFKNPQITPQHIAQVLAGGMNDQVDEIKLAAIKAMASIICSGQGLDKKGRNDIGPSLAAESTKVLSNTPADMFPAAAIALTAIIMTYPALFTAQLAHLTPLLESMCLPSAQVAAQLPSFLLSNASVQAAPLTVGLDKNREHPDWEEIDNERYAAAQELLLTLFESSKPATIRKFSHKPGGLEMISIFLARMIMGIGQPDGSEEAQDNLQDWLDQEDLDEDDENYPVIPEEGLDRFAAFFPGPPVCQLLFERVQQLLQSADWRARHTSLMAVAAVGENVQETMAPQLPHIIEMIAPLAADPHPRVRYAVCHALGQLATDFEEEIQGNIRHKVIRVEIDLLSAPEHRVAAHAAAAIVNFVDGSDAEKVAPYLDEMVSKLLQLLENRPIFVNEQALTTIASIAITAEKDFARFYSTIMPLLLGLLKSPPVKETRMLKARGMECAGLVGMAVGKEVFAQDALELANSLAQIQTWAKIATALGKDFQPFMSHVMPSLLNKCAIKPELMRLDPNDPDSVAGSAGWEILGMQDDSQIGIKTSALEDKAQSFEMLAVYVVEVGEDAFVPYLEPALKLCLDGLTFLFDERVREAAATWVNLALINCYDRVKLIFALWECCGNASMLPPMLAIAKNGGNTQVALEIFTKLNEAILRETDMAYLALLYNKFVEALKILDAPLPPDFQTAFGSATQFQLQTMAEARQRRQQELVEWDHAEKADAAEEEESEDMALDEIGKALFLIDANHPLLVICGSVRDLGMGQWQDEEDE